MDNNTADKITGSLSLFLRIGFYIFYIPFLEKEYGLKEFLDTLSKGKKKSFNKILIKRYVHVWLKIKSIFKTQHCWNRTMILYKFLNESGYNAVLYTGIRKDRIDKISIIGHSWVCIDGVVFDDQPDISNHYHITFSYP